MEILIVDDVVGVRLGIQKLLWTKGFQKLSMAGNGLAAWKIIQENKRISLLILDWDLPGMDGLELMKKVRSLKDRDFYIVFITASGSTNNLKIAIEAGADDFIPKPFETEELFAKVLAGERVLQNLKKEREYAKKILRSNATMKRKNAKLKHLAEKDPLTGLLNRRGMAKAFQKELKSQGGRRPLEKISVIAIDVDNFKHVNDTYGHDVGDDLLRFVACSINTHVRGNVAVGRYGGDEFLIILFEHTEVAVHISERIVKSVSENSLSETGFEISLSAGVSSGLGKNFEEMYACADSALRTAKSRGKNGVSMHR